MGTVGCSIFLGNHGSYSVKVIFSGYLKKVKDKVMVLVKEEHFPLVRKACGKNVSLVACEQSEVVVVEMNQSTQPSSCGRNINLQGTVTVAVKTSPRICGVESFTVLGASVSKGM